MSTHRSIPSKTPSIWSRCGLLIACLLVALATRTPASGSVARLKPDITALSRLPKLNLPPPPEWPNAQKDKIWSVDDIDTAYRNVTDYPPVINYTRTTFVRPDHKWLVAFNKWFSRFQKAINMQYKDDIWDCDDFAQCFVAFADLMALHGGEARGSICVGWATVANLRSFGGVPGDYQGSHALVVVGTTKGLFVIEPQSGKMASLHDYPNRDEFSEVNF